MERTKLRKIRAYGAIAAVVIIIVLIIVLVASLGGNGEPTPTKQPTESASIQPTAPTTEPTQEPTLPTDEPSEIPTGEPSIEPTPSVPVFTGTYKMTNTNDLNFRQGPDKNTDAISRIEKKSVVEVLEENLGEDGSWSKVMYDGQTGYVASKYLSKCDKGPVCTVNVDSTLNIRSQANKNSDLVTTVNKDATVKILRYVDSSWVKVELTSGQVGYCMTKYLKVAE